MTFGGGTRTVDALRWTVSVLLVLTAYALIGWSVLFRSAPAQDEGGGEPTVEIDLEPLPAAAPDSPSEAPPGPAQAQPESHAQDASEKPVEKEEVEPKPADEQRSEASLPVPDKPHVEEETQAPQVEAPPPTAPASIEAPPGPTVPTIPGQSDKAPSRALLTWQRVLVGRLERAKRYPAQANGKEGATTVSFTIDRSGRLVGSRVVRSSGSAVFDEATLTLINQSQPFPPPPDGLDPRQLSFVVTIRYAR